MRARRLDLRSFSTRWFVRPNNPRPRRETTARTLRIRIGFFLFIGASLEDIAQGEFHPPGVDERGFGGQAKVVLKVIGETGNETGNETVFDLQILLPERSSMVSVPLIFPKLCRKLNPP